MIGVIVVRWTPSALEEKMSKEKTLSIELNIQNIGPFTNLHFVKGLSKLQIAIFAPNGSGKTFLSRAFRLLSTPEPLLSVNHSNDYISIGSDNASYSLKISNPSDSSKVNRIAKISFERDSIPSIENDTDYIFHVFNSDYILDNLESKSFKPEDKIVGYILGRGNIDLSKEKNQVKELQGKIEELKLAIVTILSRAQSELESIGIRKTTNEYKIFTYDYVYGDTTFEIDEPFEELKKKLVKLNSIPDDIVDVPELRQIINFSIIDEVIELLETKYDLNNLSIKFKEKIKAKYSFIKEGINLISKTDSSICPFCEQRLEQNALELIDQYNTYLNDQEAKIIDRIEELKKRLASLKTDFKQQENIILVAKNKYNDLKQYFPSLEHEELSVIDGTINIEKTIGNLITLLINKANDISASSFNTKEITTIFKEYDNIITKLINTDNQKIKTINQIKANSNSEKLSIKRKICLAKYMIVFEKMKSTVGEIRTNEQTVTSLGAEIVERESTIRIDKKEIVATTFTKYLDYFFTGKYSFDKNDFSLVFHGKSINSDAPKILSDGEKSIISFCYFLAETYTLFSNQNEYEKLFFVIDDPISSVDFHFAYMVSQIIRDLKDTFGMKHNRFIIFTHNNEFMSILTRNKIAFEKYALKDDVISELNDSMIMPYEYHLKDIFKVARGLENPSHYTPNSIRHVIETICNFESPNSEINTFFGKSDALKRNDYLYSLINDLSHGNIRNQKAYTDDMIRSGCVALIDYINTEYGGQLKRIKKDI